MKHHQTFLINNFQKCFKNPDRIYVPHPKHGTLARYWDSSASRPTPNFPPLHYHSARRRMEGCQSRESALPSGTKTTRWFFWKKRRQKWKTNMLRYVRILDIFQAPKKNMSLSSFLEEYRDYFTKKKAQKYPIFEVLLVFFLKPLRLDPPVWFEVLDRKFWFRWFFSENSPCHTLQRRLQTPDGDGSHRLAPTKSMQVDNQCPSQMLCLIKNQVFRIGSEGQPFVDMSPSFIQVVQ